MGILSRSTIDWSELIQNFGIIFSLLLAAYTARKEQKAREIENVLTIAHAQREIWNQTYERAELFRVREKNPNLKEKPISNEEMLFVTQLILHLDTVHRAMRAGVFVKVEGLGEDIRAFFSLPIPKNIWNSMRPFQNQDFIKFLEAFLH